MIPPKRIVWQRETPLTWLRAVPALTVMAGSLLTIVPVITAFPLLPPFGLLMLLGWRLTVNDALPLWAALPLGLFDDLLSGQPAGSAMLLWTAAVLAIDLFDQRLVWRDFWQDWLLAAGGIAGCLIVGRFVASPIAANVDTVLIVQISVSAMLYPMAARLCAWLEWKRAAQ